MPSFWSYITNDKYAVGCTGQTVYVYNNSNIELARFKDIKYDYTPMFCPEHNIFVVKSTEGNIAVYSLDTMQLIKKFRFSKIDNSQDDGLCFSKDGNYFYNIEHHITGSNSCLSIYETSNFSRKKQLFISESFNLCHIEYDNVKNGLFVLGSMRKEQSDNCSFVSVFEKDSLLNITKLTLEKFDYICAYKRLEIMGFTRKAKDYTFLPKGYDLENLEQVRLSDIIV